MTDTERDLARIINRLGWPVFFEHVANVACEWKQRAEGRQARELQVAESLVAELCDALIGTPIEDSIGEELIPCAPREKVREHTW